MRISDWSSDVCSSDLPIGTKSIALRRQHLFRKIGRMCMAGGAVLIAAALFGMLIQPLGFAGVMAVTLLLIGVAVLFGKWPPFPEPRQQDLPRADLKQLAGRTEIWRSEEHTSELQSLMRTTYAVLC